MISSLVLAMVDRSCVRFILLSTMGRFLTSIVPCCHKTTARAARLEQVILVTLVLPVSNVRVVQGLLHDSLGGLATLPWMKGPKGFVRGGAWL